MGWVIVAIALVIIVAVALVVAYYFFILRPGRFDFWELASKHPDLAYDLFQQSECWHVFLDKPPGGFKASLPPGEWDGPFKLAIPQLDWKVVTIYGKVSEYEKTQQAFIDDIRSRTS